MSGRNQARNLFSRFPALTWLGAVFCFILVPLLLINEGLNGMLRLRHEGECDELFRQMNDRLNFIARHADESHYYHRILSYHFRRATRAADPIESMGIRISQLKKQFPDTMRFIVWDAKGQCVEKLTDEKGYRYVVSNLYNFFSEIAAHCREIVPGTPELLPVVEKRLSLFRSYLGRFLVPSHLRLPFQPGELGKCILADTPDRFPLFWFDVNSQLALFCAIRSVDKRAVRGIQHAVKSLNSGDSIIESGFIDIRNLDKNDSQLNDSEYRQLLMELGKFENASLPNRSTEDMLFSFKMLRPDLRGFCAVRKSSMTTGYPWKNKAALATRMGTAIALGLFIAFCYSLRHKRLSISISTRTALLFIYANGLPLMILGTIGNEYLMQKEHSLIQETHRQNEGILLEIDSGYRRYQSSLGRRTKEVLQNYSAAVKHRQPDKKDSEELRKIAEVLGADEIGIFGFGGETLLNFRRTRKTTSQTFVKMFAATSLSFANQDSTDFFLKDTNAFKNPIEATSKSLVIDNVSILKELLGTMENIAYYTFGTETKLCFARLLGDKQQRKFHSVMTIFWLKEETQAAYARQNLAKLVNSSSASRYASLAIHNGAISCMDFSQPDLLRPCLQKAFNLQTAQDNNLLINGKRYLVTAIAGRQLPNIALATIVPGNFIKEQIEQARLQIFLLALVSMLIVSGVIVTLSQQFISPVKQLSEAVKQMGRRNFSYRTSIQANDEFGDLGKVFNTTIEEMADLEIGKVVQEALFPGQNYQQNGLTIFARTVSMTKLGGDYYDFFSLADNKTGLFMGDVAGHGIPAALIMAMAKSTVLTNSDKLHDPAKLLLALHQMIFQLKSDGFKKMMTCQYLVIDNLTGEFSLANAGHCFPVIVGPQGSYARFEEIIGTPVGIARRVSYANHLIKLLPGETIVLYSDGMLEAANPQGKIYGAEKFLELTQKSWQPDLQQYYSALVRANTEWSPHAEDDITIVLARFQPEKKHA